MKQYQKYKYIRGSDKYKYVSLYREKGGDKEIWAANIKGHGNRFKTEKEAALWIDKWLIKNGRNPVNILKKVE